MVFLIHLFCHSQVQVCKNKFVFEKQVVQVLVSTCAVKRICYLISAEKATFQCEKCLAML